MNHALNRSRLDCCKVLYIDLPQLSLQLVQNAPDRFLTVNKKREYITLFLASHHWLPVKFRIDFKILLFVLRPWLGFAKIISCPPPPPHTPHWDSWDSFVVVLTPSLWNSLPFHVRSAPFLSSFKSVLKTLLFFSMYYCLGSWILPSFIDSLFLFICVLQSFKTACFVFKCD